MHQSFVATHKPGKCAVSTRSYQRPLARKSKPPPFPGSVGRSTNDLCIRRCRALILLSVALCPRAVEQATQAMTRENLSSGFPTKQVSNHSLRLNRLDRKLNFFLHEASLGMILLKRQTTKLPMRLRGCAGWSGPLLLQITRQVFSVTMCHLTMAHIRKQDAKFDYCKI